MLRIFVNCAMVIKNASIFLFSLAKGETTDHSTLVNCGEIEFLKLK